jgi:membrane associated rhomboid family serine protease
MPISPPPSNSSNSTPIGRALVDAIVFLYNIAAAIAELLWWVFLGIVGWVSGRECFIGSDMKNRTYYEWQPYSYRTRLNGGIRFKLIEEITDADDFQAKYCRRTPVSYIVLMLWAVWFGTGSMGLVSFDAWATIGAFAIGGFAYWVFSSVGTEKRIKALLPKMVPKSKPA